MGRIGDGDGAKLGFGRGWDKVIGRGGDRILGEVTRLGFVRILSRDSPGLIR